MCVALRDDDVAQDVGDRERQAAAHQREQPHRHPQERYHRHAEPVTRLLEQDGCRSARSGAALSKTPAALRAALRVGEALQRT